MMRLVSYARKDGHSYRVGVLSAAGTEPALVDVETLGGAFPGSMRELIEKVDGDWQGLAEAVRMSPSNRQVRLADVRLGPVVPDPEKIMCIGLNYRDHAEETNHGVPTVPTVFAKYANTLIGCGETIRMIDKTDQVDYEAELAVIIGKRAKDVVESEALQYVAGYSIFNDVSARDYQLRVSQWTMGKSFDTFGPLGPSLVTTDEVPDPQVLGIRLKIGNELLQDSNTGNMVFNVATLVSFLSSTMTLVPGDVIATGTPAGVGFTRTPPRFMRPGEKVEIEIEKLGKLWNYLQRDPAPA